MNIALDTAMNIALDNVMNIVLNNAWDGVSLQKTQNEAVSTVTILVGVSF